MFAVTEIQRKFALRNGLNFGRLARTAQIPAFQADIGTAVAISGLVNGHAVHGQRMIDTQGGGHFFAGIFIGNQHIAGKIFGHARVVKIDMKFLQFDGKRQFLQQQSFVCIQKCPVDGLAFHNFGIAAIGKVFVAQCAFGFEIAGINAGIVGHQFAGQHADFEQKVAVNQATDANHNQRQVGKNIAPFIHCTFFGGHDDAAVFTHFGFGFKTLYLQIFFGNFRCDAAAVFTRQFRRMLHVRQ